MAVITLQQIQAAYEFSSQVYDKEIGFEEAAGKLQRDHGLNINSARDFLTQFRCMVDGDVFKRTLSSTAMQYFLSTILQKRGRASADKAVSAAWKHIAYYEQLEGTRLKKLSSVVQQFQNSIDGPVSAEVKDAEFAAAVVNAISDSTASRQKRLKVAKKKPGVLIATTKVFIRNPDVVAEVLHRAKGSCEVCKQPAPFFRKIGGSAYLEVHHTVQLAHGGEDTVENAIAVCPNCHRKQHYG